MSNNLEMLTLFSKVICLSNIQLTKDEELIIDDYINKTEFVQHKNYNKNIINSVQGTKDRYMFKNPSLHFLQNKILEKFNDFKNNILNYKNNEFIINTSWLTKSNKNQIGDYHNHNHCMYSGVYYYKVPQNSGNIKFNNFQDKRFTLIPEKYNIYNSDSYTINVKKDLLIFFPSEIYHKIELNNSEKGDRYSIAFNLLPIGKLGKGDSTLEINF
jgi:uncharacterized protein (TIGR02466 family)